MNRPALDAGFESAQPVDGSAENIDQTSQYGFAHRYLDRTSGLPGGRTAAQAGRVFHRNAADRMSIEMFLHLNHKTSLIVGLNHQCVIDRRQSCG
jgi:hypothetical protein